MQLVVTMILIQNSCCGEMYAESESGIDPNTQLPGVPEIPPRLNTEVQHLSHSHSIRSTCRPLTQFTCETQRL